MDNDFGNFGTSKPGNQAYPGIPNAKQTVQPLACLEPKRAMLFPNSMTVAIIVK